MAEADFFRDAAKESTARSVKNVEALTSAEVVVAVRRRSGDYRVPAYHFGLFVGGAVVSYLLLAPQVFSVGDIALDGALGFGVGLALAFNISALLRLLVRERPLAKSVAEAARVTFFDLGISRTSGRNGLLVFVSTFERRAVVLTDIGIDVAALGPKWNEACLALSGAVCLLERVSGEKLVIQPSNPGAQGETDGMLRTESGGVRPVAGHAFDRVAIERAGPGLISDAPFDTDVVAGRRG